jgi:NAD(P)-dependent dehydrogenase (short-subunit alcohol dehydrogenase family)
MMRQKSGIINITSPPRAWRCRTTPLCGLEGAVAITRAAGGFAPHGIRVNSVAPGMMDTAMQRLIEEALAAETGPT